MVEMQRFSQNRFDGMAFSSLAHINCGTDSRRPEMVLLLVLRFTILMAMKCGPLLSAICRNMIPNSTLRQTKRRLLTSIALHDFSCVLQLPKSKTQSKYTLH
jgi:hypothetical protein